MKREGITTIVLMRHGEAEHNTADINSGLIDSNLTEKGHRQAHTRGQQLRRDGFVFTAVYSSVLKRSKQTAEDVIKGGEFSIPVTPIEGIQERYFGNKAEKDLISRGEFEKLVLETISPDVLNKMTDNELDNFHLVPGMESDKEVQDREIGNLRRIVRKHKGGTLLVISHSNVIRTSLVGMKLSTRAELPSGTIKNTGFVVLRTNDNGETFQLLQTEGVDFAKSGSGNDQAEIYLRFQMRRSR